MQFSFAKSTVFFQEFEIFHEGGQPQILSSGRLHRQLTANLFSSHHRLIRQFYGW